MPETFEEENVPEEVSESSSDGRLDSSRIESEQDAPLDGKLSTLLRSKSSKESAAY